MLTLESGELRASVLDVEADAARLGARYCSSGYVWQVTDARHGALLAGPCFPDPDPPPFHGQGLPEVFEIALGQHEAALGDEVYVLGVGRVRRESAVRPFHVRDNPHVTSRAEWTIKVTTSTLDASTHAKFRDFGGKLSRSLALAGRSLVSGTELENTGTRELPVRWFAHPFFPWSGAEICRLSLESALPVDAPLFENARGFLERRAGVDWTPGHYMLPRVALGGELRVEQRHPLLGSVEVECRFPLGWLALWGNAHTVSFEPFFLTTLAPGAVARWSIRYRF